MNNVNRLPGARRTITHSSVFEQIMKLRLWGTNESLCGDGASLARTTVLRDKLERAFVALSITSLVDAPCGDMNWMRHLNYNFTKYIGIDVVPDLIKNLRNSTQSQSPVRHFQVGDLTTDVLPSADAILCRDCLVHLPFADIQRARRLWEVAGFRVAFVTTFPGRRRNIDCRVGGWRPLNMEADPFNWGEPIMLLNEEHDPPFEDKSIGVWKLS